MASKDQAFKVKGKAHKMTRMLDRVLRAGMIAGLLLLFAFPSATAHLVGSWWGLPPLFFLFAAFVAALLGWGAWPSEALGLGFAGTMLISSALAAAFAYFAGVARVLEWRWLFFLWLFVGAVALPVAWKPRWPERGGRWVAALFCFVAFVRFLSSFLPAAHGDPLLYHLAGPRLWLLAGGARLVPDLPNAILASTWEYIYLWPQIFWPETANTEQLVAAQVFSQWIHLLWGWLGAAVIVERLTRKTLAGSRWYFLFPLAALFPASLQWTAGVAKNDAGIAFWSLGAWWLAIEARRSRRTALWLLSGLFAGLAVSGKISAVLFLAPALFVALGEEALANRRVPAREALLLGLAVLAGMLPVYLRNWLETANPFFPMFSKFLPSPWISQSWAEHFSSVQPTESTSRAHVILTRLREFTRESPLFFGWLVAPIALFLPRARERLRSWAEWHWVGLLSAAIFLFGFSLEAEVRYLGPSLIVLSVCGLAALRAIAVELPARFRPAAGWLALLVILAASKLPTHLLWKFPRIAPGQAFLQTHTAGDSKAWLRSHVPPGALVVIMGDNESYYLLGMRVTPLTERPDLDRGTKGVNDLRSFVRAVCELSGASYMLESRSAQIGMEKRFPGENFGEAIAFQGVSSRVYDLPRLEAKLFPGKPVECGRIPAPAYGLSSSSVR